MHIVEHQRVLREWIEECIGFDDYGVALTGITIVRNTYYGSARYRKQRNAVILVYIKPGVYFPPAGDGVYSASGRRG